MSNNLSGNILPELAIVADRSTAAIITSIYGEWGKYFALIEPPRPKRPDFTNEAKRRANLYRLCQFTSLLQVGLSDDVATELNRSFSPSEVHRVNLNDDPSAIEASRKLPLKFRASDSIAAVFLALRTNRKLEIDETAPRLSISNDFSSNCLIIVEDTDEIGTIVAVNLASFLGAHVITLPNKSRQDSDTVLDLFRRYDEEKPYLEKQRIGSLIFKALDTGISEAVLATYSWCIFFTMGILYGAIVKSVPTGHFLLYPDCGLQVLRSIAYDRHFRTALLIDPANLDSPETKSVANYLSEQGVYVRTVIGKDASVSEVAFALRHLPCDYVFFVSHGGFPKGDRISVSFTDSNGVEHNIILRNTYSLSPVLGTEKIMIMNFTEPESIDGISWTDPNKKVPEGTSAIVTHLDQALEEQRARITKSETDIEMRLCNCIKLYDGNYYGACDCFGSIWGPVVINNICNSIHHLGGLFIYGGARIYIGTSFSVLDSVAGEFAKGLIKTQKPLGEFVRDFNNSHFGDTTLACYILFGMPTHRINFSSGDNRQYYYSEVNDELTRLVKFRHDNPFEKMHEVVDWTIARLRAELLRLRARN